MNMNLGKFREMVRDREAWCIAVHWVTKSQIEQQQVNYTSIEKKESDSGSDMQLERRKISLRVGS